MNLPDLDFPACFAVRSSDASPHPALSGNGELVTAFGPTGYHCDEPIVPMQVFCLAGRRLRGPTAPLVRFGQIRRGLQLDGKPVEAPEWMQEISPLDGLVRSTLDHDDLLEQTLSFVLLRENSAAFRTILTNNREQTVSGCFSVRYRFGDWNGECAGGSYGVDAGGAVASVAFEIEQKHLGRAELLMPPPNRAVKEEAGFCCEWDFVLEPGKSVSWDLLWGVGDKLRFRYTHHEWDFDDELRRIIESWHAFHAASSVTTGVSDLDRLREMCLYDLRCNSTPWSIPPLVSPSQWEGRTFHDELYPFLGLASAGHLDRALRIPLNRAATLPKAIARSANRGAKFAWESTEDGGDGSPYGPWLEEHFHMGQFAEAACQAIFYDGSNSLIRNLYPLLAEIAQYYRLNLIEEGEETARVRACTDYDEAIFPVENGLYTVCAAIRSLELAARVSQALKVSGGRPAVWERLAAKLRAGIPTSPDGSRYLTAEGAEHRHIAEAGPVFPFRIDSGSARALATIDTFCDAVGTEMGLQPGNLPGYGGARWMWTTLHVSTAYSILGQSEKALAALVDAPAATAPGLVPCEHVSREGNAGLPYFTTAAGAFLYALHNLFVQITDDGTIRLPLLPKALAGASFSGLAGVSRVTLDAGYREGRCVYLAVHSPRQQEVVLSAPRAAFPDSIWDWKAVCQYSVEDDWLMLTLALQEGTVEWRS